MGVLLNSGLHFSMVEHYLKCDRGVCVMTAWVHLDYSLYQYWLITCLTDTELVENFPIAPSCLMKDQH